MKEKQNNLVMYQRMVLLMIGDILLLFLTSFIALLLRYEFKMDFTMWDRYLSVWYIDVIVTVCCYWGYNLYKSLWEFVSTMELRRLLYATLIAAVLKVFVIYVIMGVHLAWSWYFLEGMLMFFFSGGIRYSYRILRSVKHNPKYSRNAKKVMIIGAGEAGDILVRELLLSSQVNEKPVCFIDDDPNKKGRYLHGVKIVGGRDQIIKAAKEYDVTDIYIALPSASNKARSEILEICKDAGCHLKILPGIYQLINGEVKVSKLREVEIEDLLGREPIKVDFNKITSYLQGKVVMITGGGGSIGSELSRQVASHNPKALIIVDIYENNAYDIQMELKDKYPDLNLIVRIASIRDAHKMDVLFNEFRPEVVFHAAAHKHVPLMEDSPNEAIKNNVFGTLNVVRCADKYKVKRFVQISTDKAVNPTNIMGATKRMCEMTIQAFSRRSETEFVAVRFGNVLGSNGSVIPLFKKQIAHGGPVTVTHKDIIRYFMTIPEAVSLVLQAGSIAHGGEIFVLDMGKPVRIDDMARNLIKLSGYTPDVDIPIVYTGLRPGEKLYEELLMNEEGLKKTDNEMIHIGQPIVFDDEEYFNKLEELRAELVKESDDIKLKVSEIVPTYHPWLK